MFKKKNQPKLGEANTSLAVLRAQEARVHNARTRTDLPLGHVPTDKDPLAGQAEHYSRRAQQDTLPPQAHLRLTHREVPQLQGLHCKSSYY